jgi:hypothetical protein
MTEVTVPPEKPVSRAAIRMARSRGRRRSHLRCVTIEITDREIAAFIQAGDLSRRGATMVSRSLASG